MCDHTNHATYKIKKQHGTSVYSMNHCKFFKAGNAQSCWIILKLFTHW